MRTGPVAITEIDGGIEFGIGEQERPRTVGHIDGDLRMLAQEVTEPRQQPLGTEGGDQGQLQGGGALITHHRQGVALDSIQPAGDSTAVNLSGVSQFHTAAGTAKQLNIKECFEVGDLATHRALGQREFLGSLGEALMASGRLEADQGLGRRDLAAHGAGSFGAVISYKYQAASCPCAEPGLLAA